MVCFEMPSSSLSKAGNWRGEISSQGIRHTFRRGRVHLYALPGPRSAKPPLPRPRAGAACTVESVDQSSQKNPWVGRRLHFIGIGGAGMSALALVARKLGATVTGSDR